MAFEIELVGIPHLTVRKRIVDVLGRDRVSVESDHLVVVVPDQPAAVGAINTINRLGCDIAAVRRSDSVSGVEGDGTAVTGDHVTSESRVR